MIDRPNLQYDDKSHTYRLNGEKLLGVSTVSKLGDTEAWGVASAWSFRLTYEGVVDLLAEGYEITTKDDLREALKRTKRTPWHTVGDAKDRGNAVHEALENLAQKNEVPILENFPEAQRGYVQGLCKWYLDYRPVFLATEIQVVSEKHLFAGRYDMIVEIEIDDEQTPPGP